MQIKLPTAFEIRDYNLLIKRNKFKSFLESFLAKHGYLEIDTLDFMLEQSLPNNCKQSSGYLDSFKFVDSDGSMLFMPSNIIPKILISARLASEHAARYFSIKDCYSFLSSGSYRNLSQIALLHYGVDNVAVEAEIIGTAMQLIKELNINDYTININDTRILSGAIRAYNPQEVSKNYIKSLLDGQTKNNIDNACLAMLNSLIGKSGDIMAIKDIADNVDNKESIDGLSNLVDLSLLLQEYGCENNILYRTDFLGHDEYEEGLVFNVMVDNQIIMHGGRYCCTVDGQTLFGMGLKLNFATMLKAFSQTSHASAAIFDVVIATSTSNLSLIKAYKLKGSCIESDLKVNILYNKSMDELKSYAKEYQIENAIFVDNYGNLEYI